MSQQARNAAIARINFAIESRSKELRLDTLGLEDEDLQYLPSLESCLSLERLELFRNALTRLPKGTSSLCNLKTLRADFNNIKTVPGDIEGLDSLETLDLSHNCLAEVSSWMFAMPNLTSLNLGSNSISQLPEIPDGFRIAELILDRNPLTILPLALGRKDTLELLSVRACPQLYLPPPSVYQQGIDSIKLYLQSYGEDEVVTNWTSKIMVVGESSVGKTTLVNNLVHHQTISDAKANNNGSKPAPTVGFNIYDWCELQHPDESSVTLSFRVWDFGGHSNYQGVHQLFYTPDTLFILVWDARRGFKESNAFKWLDRITYLQPNAPVLLVATHADEAPKEKAPLSYILTKYKHVINQDWSVDNNQKTSMESLRQAISRLATNGHYLHLMGHSIPLSFNNVFAAVRNARESIMSIDDVRAIASDAGLSNDALPIVLGMLRNLGEILFLDDETQIRTQRLGQESNYVILDPSWFGTQVGAMLDATSVESEGLLLASTVSRVWKKCDPSVQDFLLTVMEELDQLYVIPGHAEANAKGWIPEQLPVDPPKSLSRFWGTHLSRSEEMTLRVEYELKGDIPIGIPTYFLTRAHRFLQDNPDSNCSYYHWRYGAILQDEDHDHRAFLEADPTTRKITLNVVGPYPHCFMQLLRDGIENAFHERFPGLQYQSYTLCPGNHPGPSRECNWRFRNNNIIRAVARRVSSSSNSERQYSKDGKVRQPTLECNNSGQTVAVSRLVTSLQVATPIELYQDDFAQLPLTRFHSRDMLDLLIQTCPIKNDPQDNGRKRLSAFIQLFQRESVQMYSPIMRAEPKARLPYLHLAESEGDDVEGDDYSRMYLTFLCQAPGHWHPELQSIPIAKSTWDSVQPVNFFQFNWLMSAYAHVVQVMHERFKANVNALLSGWTPNEISLLDSSNLPLHPRYLDPATVFHDRENACIFGLTAFRKLFADQEVVMKKHLWSFKGNSLHYYEAPEGHAMWLCQYHLDQYVSRSFS